MGDPLPPCCCVEGCERRTWEGYQDGDLRICCGHRRQLQTWRMALNQGSKTEEDRPFVRAGGVLAVNPRYDKRAAANGGGGKPVRLTRGDVETIRREYRPGTVAVLASRYGVSRSRIYEIARKRGEGP